MASRLPLIIACALLSGAAGAAELGEPQIRSYIGQRLVADIELTALDTPATPVQVRLAHPNVYRGANIGMPHVLSTLNMTVTQRDGRQFLRVTSLAPVESSRLHLYLELADGGQRNVRLATLLVAPDPNPPPPPAPARLPAPVVADTPAPAPVAPVVAKPPRPRPAPPPKPVVAKVEPAPKPESKPESKPELKPELKPEPKPEPKPAPKQETPPAAEPKPAHAALPLPLATPAAPGACLPSQGVDRSTVCAALDYKNAQLREQIGQLEDKVKVLQVALGANPASVGKPRPADPTKPHPARRRPAPEPEAATPWGWIGGGLVAVLALAGGALVLLRRRKRAGEIQPMPGVPLMARLRQRFTRKKVDKNPVQEPVEPKLEEAEREMSTQV